MNVRSLLPKLGEVEGLLQLLNFPKALLLSETWLTIDSPMLNICNYVFASSPRVTGRGGGVGIYLHDSIKYSMKVKSSVQPVVCHTVEYLAVELLDYKIMLCCMYCPPNSSLADIMAVITYFKTLLSKKFSLIIGGDFNINLLDIDSDLVSDFLNNLHSLSLHPVISLPTRVSGSSSTIIDNFICDFSFLPLCSSVIKIDLSDHYLIEINLPVSIPTVYRFRRNLCIKNKAKFSSKLLGANWSQLYSLTDTNTAFNYFLRKFKRIYNKCFPFERTVTARKRNPWLTPAILKSIRYKNNLFLKAKADPTYCPVYKAYRNHLTKLIRQAKFNYHKSTLFQLRNSSRKMWSHLNSLINPNNVSKIPVDADTLNHFFTSVFNQAPKFQQDQPHTMPVETLIPNSFYLSAITYDEIIITLNSLSNSKAIGVDGIDPEIVQANAVLISEQLTYIFNLSFSQGIFPQLLKRAIVIPIFKSGSHADPGNYRPISILTIFSKLLEKLFYNRIISFINNLNVIHSHQFGFVKQKSTSLAVANVLSSIVSKYNSNNKLAFVLLDLKKAFDFINHDLLQIKLKHYGFRGLPLQWLSSYLSNRSQKVKINDFFSSTLPVSAGVPQGSILGPVLFNIFVNDVFQFSSANCEIYLYADDTALIFSASNNCDLQGIIDKFFESYCVWSRRNCIVVNPVKSNYLLFNSTNVGVAINGCAIENVKFAKYLGVHLDDRLNWSHHVSYVTKLCCQRIGIFKKILPCLPKHVMLLYYNAFIRSCFSYCLMFWINNARSGRQKLFDKIDHLISNIANKLGLTLSEFIAKFQVMNVWRVYKMQCLSFMYEITNNIISVPSFPLFVNAALHGHYTRGCNNIHITTVSSLDHRNFIYSCVNLWNACPTGVRSLHKVVFLRNVKFSILSET